MHVKTAKTLRFRFLFILFLISNINAEQVKFKEYALPKNSVRKKLDSILKSNHDIKAIERDSSWKDFKSWHWLIGQLTTNGGNTKFVIKAAKYPAGKTVHNILCSQTHTDQQNLSRIKKAIEANRIIEQKKLKDIKVPRFWIYPISGNDEDLDNPNITDQNVIIIEEMVEANKDPKANLNLKKESFEQLVTLVKKGKFLDLHPNNILIDKDEKIVLIDLEDILSHDKQEINNSNFLLRPFKHFKLKYLEDASSKLTLSRTGLAQNDPDIKKQALALQKDALFTLAFKRNIFEVSATLTLYAAVIVVVIKELKKEFKTEQIITSIKKCRTEIKNRIQKLYTTNVVVYENDYIEAAKITVKKIYPKETREEMFKAFATIEIAENLKNQTKKVRILGIEYNSAKDAINKSITLIKKLLNTPIKNNINIENSAPAAS